MSSRTYFQIRRQLLEKARSLRTALLARNRDEDLIRRLSERLTALIARLKEVMSLGEIRRILAGVGLAVALQGATTDLQAQSFASAVTNPFGLESIYNGVWIDAADIDNDGDLDVFVGGYIEYSAQLHFFENTGTPEEPAFADPVVNPFGINGDGFDLFMPEFADIDADGDLDLIATYLYGLVFLENTGDAENPEFAEPVDSPFGFAQPYDQNIYRPNLADLDGDGDLDLLVGAYYDYYSNGYEAGVYYFENTGSSAEPQFAEGVENPFGITPVYYIALPTLADLDGDGDLDLLIGDTAEYDMGNEKSNLTYFENVGDAQNPEFANRQVDPFGLEAGNYLSYPCFADMDDDGDLDLFIGQVDQDDYDFGEFLYSENLGTSSTREIVDSKLLQVSPNPSSDHLLINTDLDLQSLEIVDALGRSYSLPIDRMRVDISQLPSGLTVVRATTADGAVYIRKALKVE